MQIPHPDDQIGGRSSFFILSRMYLLPQPLECSSPLCSEPCGFYVLCGGIRCAHPRSTVSGRISTHHARKPFKLAVPLGSAQDPPGMYTVEEHYSARYMIACRCLPQRRRLPKECPSCVIISPRLLLWLAAPKVHIFTMLLYEPPPSCSAARGTANSPYGPNAR